MRCILKIINHIILSKKISGLQITEFINPPIRNPLIIGKEYYLA